MDSVRVQGRVVDRNGRAIPGAEVFGAPPCGVPRREWNLIPFESRRPERRLDFARAVSRSDGAFELSAERGEELHLAVRGPGWIGLDLLWPLPPAMTELDLGTLVLDPGAVVAGIVVDDAGLPVPGAELARRGVTDFTARTRLDWSGVVLATSATDGTFRLDTLGPRTELEVRAPGFVRERRDLLASEHPGGELRVVLERAAPITGRVVGAPSDAALGVYFWLQALDEQHHVPCAADGSFVIDGLSASLGSLDLYAVRRRAPSTGIDLEAIAFPDWERISSSVSVRPGTSGVVVRVPGPITYRMRVVDSRTEEPLSGVRIGLLAGLDLESPAPTEALAEGLGVYSLSMLLPWESDGRALAVSREGYERLAVGELPFVPGETQDLGTVSLTRLAPTLVRITSGDGSPVEGAVITAAIETNDEGCLNAHMVGSWPARSALPDGWSGTSSAEGTATAYLSRGTLYWIQVGHPGHPVLGQQVVTEPSPPERLELQLLRGGTVTLLCLDARTRTPLAGKPVWYDHSCWRERLEVQTGADGRARLEHLVPCSYRFWAASGAGRYERFVRVEEGASLEITLVIDTP